jgi:hypothetical protein
VRRLIAVLVAAALAVPVTLLLRQGGGGEEVRAAPVGDPSAPDRSTAPPARDQPTVDDRVGPADPEPPPDAALDLGGDLPGAVEPAFAVPEPRTLAGETAATWAPVRRDVDARRRPSVSAPVVARVGARTPEATRNVVQVLARATRQGRVWVRVRLAALPNGRTGWVPRSALGGYGVVHTHLVVDRAALTATLLRDGKPVFRAPVGIGTVRWPTPAGRFYVRVELRRYASAFYGPVAFGTSARSAVLTDWPAGGFVGIHGTDRPDLVPGRVSHGCIRLRNRDVLRLASLMPVGTPITIR